MQFYAIYNDPAVLASGETSGRPVAQSFLGDFLAPSDALPALEACKARTMADDADSLARWIGVYGSEEAARAAWLERIGRPLGYEAANMRAMSAGMYMAHLDLWYGAQPLQEITADRFNDLLEVLPPVQWVGNALFESFHMLEKQEFEWRTQVMRIQREGVDRYFTKYATTADPVTHDDLIQLINEAK